MIFSTRSGGRLMQSEIQIFDPSRIGLKKGINLVEASAGTGKTYAIAMLVLRFVAELDIPIDKLLVVTFGKAASEELKTRIRARLSQARDLLQGKSVDPDQTLADWAVRVTNRELMLSRLELALYDIDRAGIFTIHSFCQRMLQEQALESGQLFDVELLADIDHIRAQVVDDYWRTHVYRLASLPCSILTASFPTPELLYASVGAASAAARIEPETADINASLARLETAFDRMTSWWQANGPGLFSFYAQAVADQKFKGGFCADFEDWWQGIAGFFGGADSGPPAKLHLLSRAGLLGELNGNKLRGEARKLDFLAAWPLPEGEITELLQAGDDLLLSFRVGLAAALKEGIEQRLLQLGTMSFNDLILRLSAALHNDRSGDLRRILQERYRAALIDEFQDTDAAQWHIFSTLFGGGGHFLYLIGDPKQAIYRFRGADIFSYFTAKKFADAHLTLNRNYRSHPHLVEEVNRLFGARPQPFGFPEATMAYHPVVPAKAVKDFFLRRDGRISAAMIYCQLPESEKKEGRWSSGRAAEEILRFTVREVVRLLGPENPALLAGKDGPRPVQPKDIAILVRSNRQAEQHLQAFAQAAIPAVVASRQSVFTTVAAREIGSLLAAIAAPGDILLLKTAMTIPWFGLSGDALQGIWQDETVFDRWHSRFQSYFRLWQEQGFLTMMSRLLVDEGVFATLAGETLAERHIANIAHLLELIQAAESTDNLGCGQTLQWLRTMMSGGHGVEDIELRLESDEEAVRIVTMHSAKGLEYPIVLCPCLWNRSDRLSREKFAVACNEDESGLVVDLGSPRFEERKEKAATEELAEELRLLYVAVTRAQVCCYIFWADVKATGTVADSFSAALGYLLFPEGPVDFPSQQAVLQSLAKQDSVEYCLVAGDETAGYQGAAPAVTVLAPLQPSGRSLRTDWQMSSYSAMAALSEHEDQLPADRPVVESGPIACPGLPAGAGFGNVVHNILERVPFSAIAAGGDISEELSRQCTRYGVRVEAGSLQQLLHTIVTTPLSVEADSDFSLAGLDHGRSVREMPFYFHPDRIATEEINTILADDPTVTPLARRVMQGYLTGFVDLFCEHRGRYYILDYKTNYLGDLASDYAPDNLVRAMEAHNYGLQYWIYTLVLHRHLTNVLPGYTYEDRFGGVMYLFVRGMEPARPGSGVYFFLPEKGILDRLSACVGGGA
jgi:exodeoxyribonuclease V beta subunit